MYKQSCRCNITDTTLTTLSANQIRCDVNSTVIRVRGNISEVDSQTLIGFKAVKVLDLSNNSRLSFVPEEPFLKSASLLTLQLEFCNLTAIYEATFAQLQRIQQIVLTGNHIRTISDSSFDNNGDLEVLILKHNHVVQLSSFQFDKTKKLHTLNLNGNANLSFTRGWMQRLDALRELHCDDCRQNVTIFGNLLNLELLSIRYWVVNDQLIKALKLLPKIRMICINETDFNHNIKLSIKHLNLSKTCQTITVSITSTTALPGTSTPLMSDTSTDGTSVSTPTSTIIPKPTMNTILPEVEPETNAEVENAQFVFLLSRSTLAAFFLISLVAAVPILWAYKNRKENSFQPGYPYESSILNSNDIYDILKSN